MKRLNRPEVPLAPLMTHRPAGGENRFVGNEFCQITLDTFESLRDASHPWPPRVKDAITDKIIAGMEARRKYYDKLRGGADLHAK